MSVPAIMSLTADMHSLISLVSSWDIEPPQISLALLLLDVELRFFGRTYFEIYAKQGSWKDAEDDALCV